jgi:hypothetical protein
MKTLIVPAAVVLFIGVAQAVLAAPPTKEPGKEVAGLEKKLLGDWQGYEGCSGKYAFRADGTYKLTNFGPGGDGSAGTWKVRWDALPPTLVLTCKESELDEEIGKDTKLMLLELNDAILTLEYEHKTVFHYARPKK